MEKASGHNTYYNSVYQKSLEIFKISRRIAAYYTDDRDIFGMQFSTDPSHRFAGELITRSLQLPPGVASIAVSEEKNTLLKRIKKIRKSARYLRESCKKLQLSGIKEREFISLLLQEINHFEKLLSDWLQNLQLRKNLSE